MSELPKENAELGTVTALLRRAALSRIPKLIDIKEFIDAGNALSDGQITYLSEVFRDAQRALPFIDDNPALQDSSVKVIALYQAIMEKAIANEEAGLKTKLPPIDFPK